MPLAEASWAADEEEPHPNGRQDQSAAEDHGSPELCEGRFSEQCGYGTKLLAQTGRRSNVAASPDLTSDKRPPRQRGDRPCAVLRWPRTANRASGRPLRLPSETFVSRSAGVTRAYEATVQEVFQIHGGLPEVEPAR